MLNSQQEAASNKIENWFNTQEQPIFVLAGHAGTGKSYLINYLVNNILPVEIEQVAYVAPTAKAASILIKKGLPATTIHRLIYINDDDYYVNGKKIPHFIKKKEIPNFKLIIIDELSMVSKKIIEDLLSFNIPILACGDPAQLPPVLSEDPHLLDHPDAILTDIVRQEEGNPIIDVSIMARNHQEIPYGKYGDNVYVVNRHNLSDATFDKLLMTADQVICGTNKTRNKLNKYIRNLLGYTSDLPEKGDKIICCQNNYDFNLGKNDEYPLANGIIGYVDSFEIVNEKEYLGRLKFKPDFMPDFTSSNLINDIGIFNTGDFIYDRHQRIYQLNKDINKKGIYTIVRSLRKEQNESIEQHKQRVSIELKNKNKAVKDFQISQFEFGYAISCHKSQGSEWDNVIVIDESEIFTADKYKWLYTAITRAKKNLVILRLEQVM